MLKDTFNKFAALIHGLENDAVQDAFINFQKSLEYCMEENVVLREVLRDQYHCRRLTLDESQKKRLANKAINLNKSLLNDVSRIFHPDTVLGWHRELIGKKYDSTGTVNAAKRGPNVVCKNSSD